ncbi:hypothetical protein PIB30_086273, partial [Stylosanthes scabra]|nr:hypothetical protein [Stylosanthes scabra]
MESRLGVGIRIGGAMAAGVPYLSPALWGDDDYPRGRGLSAWASHGRGARERLHDW